MSQVPSKRAILLIAVGVAVVMYLAGVLSGLYANAILERKVEADLSQVEQDIDYLRSYMDSSALDLKNIQLLQFFADNIGDRCAFSELYLGHLYDQLRPYWDRLPDRLEEYERNVEPTSDYIVLKREYTRLSLRIWLIAQRHAAECESDFIPLLYFYSADCPSCVEQGRMIDSFRDAVEAQGKRLTGFVVDESFEDDAVYLLKQYYNITGVPAVIVGGQVIQDDLISTNRLLQAIS